jgi:arylsulfatase
MRPALDDPQAKGRRTQFYSMLGSRSIWHDGWKAVTTHPTIAGWGHFGEDTWQLYHTDVDRSETVDLAAGEPAKLQELVQIWFKEAGANGAFPLDDRTPLELFNEQRPQLTKPRNRYVYFPDAAAVPEWQAVNTRNRSFVIGALVDIESERADGVLFAIGSRFGGHALYIKHHRLCYVNNFVGIDEQRIVGEQDVPIGTNLILSASFEMEGMQRDHTHGTLSLFHGPTKVGEATIKTQLGPFAVAGAGLYVGRQGGEPVTEDFPGTPPYRFGGGRIHLVGVDVSGDPYVDLEREAAMLVARE